MIRAWFERWTICSLPFFVLDDGIVQVPVLVSISDHFMPETSSLLCPVSKRRRWKELNTSFVSVAFQNETISSSVSTRSLLSGPGGGSRPSIGDLAMYRSWMQC